MSTETDKTVAISLTRFGMLLDQLDTSPGDGPQRIDLLELVADQARPVLAAASDALDSKDPANLTAGELTGNHIGRNIYLLDVDPPDGSPITGELLGIRTQRSPSGSIVTFLFLRRSGVPLAVSGMPLTSRILILPSDTPDS